MDWRAANEQQQEALWRVFLMFIAMALLIIRTGLVSRNVLAILTVENAPQDAARAGHHQPPATSRETLYQATLTLLRFAEAAGRLLILSARAVWELMNLPRPNPAPEWSREIASQCVHASQSLDTS